MPPSQLKRLKSSLREQGITGPQKSKKQKKAAKGAKGTNDRVQRNVALQQIRDSLNPFELKAPSRPPKFQHANSNTNGAAKVGRYKDVLYRPGVSKSAGEEMRKKMLLPEMQRRNKVGGLVDRRIGEGDMRMTAEERAVQRFTQEKQRKKGASLFDLENSDDDEPILKGLTHGGRNLDELAVDEVAADDFSGDESVRSEGEDGELMHRKRRRSDLDVDEEQDIDGGDANEEPERKKTKKEVMEEVIAKSKLHKYERQKAKEDDDDLRDELDQDMSDILSLLKGHKTRPPPTKSTQLAPDTSASTMNPDRQRLLDGADPAKVEQDYNARLKKLAQDVRARPSNKTKTDAEKAIEEAANLKALEERRVKRMRGVELSDDEDGEPKGGDLAGLNDDDQDEAAEFGFTNSIARPLENETMDFPDEDEFELDDELIASGSEADMSDDSGSEQGSNVDESTQQNGVDEEDEFVRGLFGDVKSAGVKVNGHPDGSSGAKIAFTYPCPRTHDEILEVIKESPPEQFAVIVQRIRALHHPSLSASNKEAMADFSEALVQHLPYMGTQGESLVVTEQIIRHLHSLSRTYPERIANAFRGQLQEAHERKELHAGDLIVLTAIGAIYPTSDHFHQVVTPAMILMARWLGMSTIDSAQKDTTGAYLVALCISYQRLSKRYVTEAMQFTRRALASQITTQDNKHVHLENLLSMAEMWKDKTSFIEILQPTLPLVQKLGAKRTLQTLRILIQQSRIRRRPLELHHHRPLSIRTSVPKFEGTFDPDKHYDPDKERSDAKKLQKEYKRERKGALRELRKDANFVARQQLQEQKARDVEYEKKYRRLVAEIQGTEGHEAKEYEREKRARKRQK